MYSNVVDKVVSIIKSIGIDNYKGLIDDYDSNLMDQVLKGKHPTNNQILEGTPWGYFQQNAVS